MQELKDRIVKEGKVLPGNIIKVDGFLNHRIDTELMDHIAEEFGKHFNMDEVTMILTAEASGIALSGKNSAPGRRESLPPPRCVHLPSTASAAALSQSP